MRYVLHILSIQILDNVCVLLFFTRQDDIKTLVLYAAPWQEIRNALPLLYTNTVISSEWTLQQNYISGVGVPKSHHKITWHAVFLIHKIWPLQAAENFPSKLIWAPALLKYFPPKVSPVAHFNPLATGVSVVFWTTVYIHQNNNFKLWELFLLPFQTSYQLGRLYLSHFLSSIIYPIDWKTI